MMTTGFQVFWLEENLPQHVNIQYPSNLLLFLDKCVETQSGAPEYSKSGKYLIHQTNLENNPEEKTSLKTFIGWNGSTPKSLCMHFDIFCMPHARLPLALKPVPLMGSTENS